MIIDTLFAILIKNSILTAFVAVGVIMWFSYFLSDKLTRGKFHGSAIAISLGLVLAYMGGLTHEGSQGLANIEIFSGMAILGGAMFRDFAIVATAFGANLNDLKSSGLAGIISLFLGVLVSFVIGATMAVAFGYTDPVDVVTIGAGAVTYIVGPVTGAALSAGSDIIAISVAAGLVKSILVMVSTPLIAKKIGLNNPQSAMIFGGLMGTTSGVAAGLAATDPKLVPYGAMTATFYTGLGCLLCPSVLYFATVALLG